MHQNFCHNTILLRLHVDGRLVGLLQNKYEYVNGEGAYRDCARTISSKTSPAAKASPSFFFH